MKKTEVLARRLITEGRAMFPGAKSFNINYSGSGDSFNDLNADGGGKYGDFAEKFIDELYELIQLAGADQNNEGCYGTVTVDLENGILTVDVNNGHMEYTSESRKFGMGWIPLRTAKTLTS